jgi:thymidylate synthase
MTNEEILMPYFEELYDKIQNEDFVELKGGVKTVEIISPRIQLDPASKYLNFGPRKTPKKYVEAELQWYDSQSLSVDFIAEYGKIWKHVSDDNGFIHSNYGYLIYSPGNFLQYNNALSQLKDDASTRRATMIYTRPSMQYEYNANGMSDFICTFATQQFIRNNKLLYIVYMRSNDVIYGLFNDFAWHAEVYERLYNDLLDTYPNLEYGSIIWNAASFHAYDRHFDMIQNIVEHWRG